MSVGMVVVLALFSALWIIGLIDQLHSDISTMRYLVISLAVIAAGVFQFSRRKKE
jgi:predicted metal-binding membrane protein